MMSSYLMESDKENERIDRKTDRSLVHEQATWAGIKPNHRALDVGCMTGITTKYLSNLCREVVGIDANPDRTIYALEHHCNSSTKFIHHDIIKPWLNDLGFFDFVWCRFYLEYHAKETKQILRNMLRYVSPGGLVCLIDLDLNCLIHYPVPEVSQETFDKIAQYTYSNLNFDAYVGRKLYTLMVDAGLTDLRVKVDGYNVIAGEPTELDLFNWACKQEKLTELIPFDDATEAVDKSFKSPQGFTYTPIIQVVGRKT